MSIQALFFTTSIFGSTVPSILAQGNETGEVQVGTQLLLTEENMSMPMDNVSNVTTAVSDSSAVGETPTHCCSTRRINLR